MKSVESTLPLLTLTNLYGQKYENWTRRYEITTVGIFDNNANFNIFFLSHVKPF